MTTPIISRQEAKANGAKRYFTGQTCSKGHTDERFVSSGGCCTCAAVSCTERAEYHREYNKGHYVRNRDAVLARQREYVAANQEARTAYVREYYVQNRDRTLAVQAAWRSANKHKKLAQTNRRRVRKYNAIPKWYGEFDEFVFDEAALLAQRREVMFGYKWHIDHMVPLSSKTACGLHVAENVAVIPQRVNISKGYRMMHTTPGSWLQAV